MEQLPIFLNVRGTPALVVGGGFLAARKADLLLRAGCKLTVVAPELGEELARLAEEHEFHHETGELTAAHLEGCKVVFGCSHERSVNLKLRLLAIEAGVLVNLTDDPENCDFIMPAVVDRSPLLLAVASGGASPILTRMLKARFETAIPAAYGRLAEFAGRYRERLKETVPNMTRRRRFWEDVIDGPVAEHVYSGQIEEAESLIEKLIAQTAREGSTTPVGEVYLVGAGPGDPDLLTFRALRLMQQADVVLYDRLIGDGILNLVRRDASRIYVGKRPKDHTVSQEEIGEMLVRLAREGKRVLRLKGGDPFTFGRGGEEIEALSEHGITFQVIPGVTAASGCAAYAGIPLTHRDHAQACIFVTGHDKNGTVDLNWETLIQPGQTVVVYMGLSSLARITEGFIAHGADSETPAAVVENGTREGQRVISGTLASLAARTEQAGVVSPALIIVGGVVTLRDKLSWFAGTEQEENRE
jgi:uroporphyrin-III C-methyltransferase/precorrin-2 dehydrogenase/sirohydrochlorin ferrochelatase